MFSITEVSTPNGTVQFREEQFTGFRCRISPDRSKRHRDHQTFAPPAPEDCPFCRDRIFSVTPPFPDGMRIIRGESVTFPNMFPFGQGHVVTVLTRDHYVERFSRQQILDGLLSQIEALCRYDGYPSINWNFLPSAGASLVHPHMQGLCDLRPSRIAGQYLGVSRDYRSSHGGCYWDVLKEAEKASERYLFGDEIVWAAHAVPVGEREIRGYLPISTIDELEPYADLLARGILEVIAMYRKLGTYAFNLAVFFDNPGTDNGFRAFCSIISRINPNPSSTSDSAFMERLHLEPVIMTLPEDLGALYRNGKK
jgi:UDPglucose--hexose-1-phosphate uridylyltransferase